MKFTCTVGYVSLIGCPCLPIGAVVPTNGLPINTTANAVTDGTEMTSTGTTGVINTQTSNTMAAPALNSTDMKSAVTEGVPISSELTDVSRTADDNKPKPTEPKSEKKESTEQKPGAITDQPTELGSDKKEAPEKKVAAVLISEKKEDPPKGQEIKDWPTIDSYSEDELSAILGEPVEGEGRLSIGGVFLSSGSLIHCGQTISAAYYCKDRAQHVLNHMVSVRQLYFHFTVTVVFLFYSPLL